MYPDDRANNRGDEDPGEFSSDSPRRLFVGQKNHRRWLRRFARRVVDDPDFDALVVLVVLANCVSLALFRPTEPHDSGWNLALERTELALNGFFTIELALRVARGGFDEYWADPWNRFDALLVAGGYGGVVARAFQESGGGGASAGRFSRSLERRGRGWAARVAGAAGAASVARDHSFRVASLGGGVLHRGGAPVGLRRRPGRAVRVRVRARGADALFQEAYHLRCANRARGGSRRTATSSGAPSAARSTSIASGGAARTRRRTPRGPNPRGPDRRLAPIARDVRIVRALVSRSRPDDRRRAAVRAGGERPRDRRRRVRQRRARDAHRVSVHDARRVGAGDVPGHGLGRRPSPSRISSLSCSSGRTSS